MLDNDKQELMRCLHEALSEYCGALRPECDSCVESKKNCPGKVWMQVLEKHGFWDKEKEAGE